MKTLFCEAVTNYFYNDRTFFIYLFFFFMARRLSFLECQFVGLSVSKVTQIMIDEKCVTFAIWKSQSIPEVI